MFVVTMENEGGELDRKAVKTAADAKEALAAMIERLDEVYGGDVFRVRESE